ncbi:MAG TPA: hypothetical protein VFW12_07785 [Candidatus Limnocylindria bacterium]|nr:hypothetical protein [Candidatus Limnocylindria bacterium]
MNTRSRIVPGPLATLAICLVLIGAFAQSGLQMTAASAESGASISAAPLAAPVAQCNDDTASNVGGQGVRCTVTVANFVTSTGAIDPLRPSTVTVTRCVGAAGPVAAGAGTCTTTTSTSTSLVASITQCNGSANGGGGVLICTVTMTNTFAGGPAATPATVYQCIGSVITGTGAPGTCTPANTPGIGSVSAATVGQCNGSGNGGTSVGFVCTVGSSTISSTLTVHVDQCNGSANGGGSLVSCSAQVNAIVEAQATATPGPTATVAPSATPAPAAATPAPVSATPAPATAAPVAAAPAPIAKLPSTSTQDPDGVPGWALGAMLALFLLLAGVGRMRLRRAAAK